jgi:SAM-dependent methyltransferase
LFILPFAGGVPYVALKKKNLKKIFSQINLPEHAKIADLGCGDGRVLRYLEKNDYKNLYGYEINLWPYLICRVKNMILGSDMKIYLKNFEKADLKKYDVIFCYLLTSYLEKLKNKFEKELKPGAKIISYGFQIRGWEPSGIVQTQKNTNVGTVYIYEK